MADRWEECDDEKEEVETGVEPQPWTWRMADTPKHNGRVCLRKPWYDRLRELRGKKRIGFNG